MICVVGFAPRAALAGALALLGCASGAEYSGPLPTPDGAQFVAEVYPTLLRDCAYSGCHGRKERFFQLYGPGRVRMPAEDMSSASRVQLDYADPVSLDEVRHAYDRARSMLASAEHVDDSLLLLKPLEPQAGGQGHKGVDDLGRNVYAAKSDRSWQLLHRWAKSQGEQPTADQLRALNEAAGVSEVQP